MNKEFIKWLEKQTYVTVSFNTWTLSSTINSKPWVLASKLNRFNHKLLDIGWEWKDITHIGHLSSGLKSKSMNINESRI